MLNKTKWILGGGVVIVIGVIYFMFFRTSNKAETRYITEEVSKGTLLVSVTGSGQVEASNQIDLSPKVSGEVVTLSAVKGQEFQTGQQIAVIDSSKAQKTVRDAELNLKNAEISLEKLNKTVDEDDVAKAQSALQQANLALVELQEPLDEYEVLTQQNELDNLERDLEKTKEDRDKIEIDAEQELEKSYDDIYSAVSNAYLEIPEMIDDSYDVMWDSVRNESYKSSYIHSVGDSSIFISEYESDYYTASQMFDANFEDYKSTPRDSSNEVILKLLDDTLGLAEEVFDALESSRNLLDAQINSENLTFFSTSVVEPMLSVIQADISKINQQISSLQSIQDSIDDIVDNLPDQVSDAEEKIEDAERAIESKKLYLEDLTKGPSEKELLAAQEDIRQKQVALEDLYEGVDPLDIESQQLVIQERQNALNDAKADLADYIVRAPFDLVVAEVSARLGDNISSGNALATVITEKMIATISLNEVDISKVKVGNKVTLTFDAIENLTMAGEVSEVDLIGEATQGVVNYNVKITFEPQDERIKSGMSVSAAIITESKTDVLMVSSSALKNEGETYYVEVLENAGEGNGSLGVISETLPVEKNVEIGISNDTSTEIISGLEEGAAVVTRTVSGGSPSPTSAASISSMRNTSFGGASAFGGGSTMMVAPTGGGFGGR